MKKILLAGLLATSMFYNVACDSSDVAAGAIGVGVGIGLGNMNDHHGSDRYDHGGRYNRGGYDRGGYNNGRRHCNGYRCVESAGPVVSTETATFAQKHNISEQAAVKIETAFQNVSNSGLAAFQAIGLNDQAVKAIMNMSTPDESSVNSMAQSLNISSAQSHHLLRTLVGEFQVAAADGQSNYWQSCQAKGQWKTPQNANCSNASWNGCSPETGATLCY